MNEGWGPLPADVARSGKAHARAIPHEGAVFPISGDRHYFFSTTCVADSDASCSLY